jgi:signal transduction histidine kinase
MVILNPVPRNPLRALGSAGLWDGCAHLATDAVAGFVGMVVLFLFGISLCLVPFGFVGVPLVVASVWLLMQLASAERTRFAATCGWNIPAPAIPYLPKSPLKAMRIALRSREMWRLCLYFLLLIPVATGTFIGVALAWALPVMLAFLPTYYWALASGRAQVGPFMVTNFGSSLIVAAFAIATGLFISPLFVRALVAIDLYMARQLLAAPVDEQLTQRVEELTESRARVVDAAEAERRRIERDLHDGAQQRLVAMQMTLGRLRSRLRTTGDEESIALIDDARREARQAIGEIRDLTRGLHPPVLTDRGLDAALSAIAARAPIPVSVDVQTTPRPSITVEAIAYFVVTEALTNVVKHAAATRATVTIRRTEDILLIAVGDDGRGGANPAVGTGLAGLADRVAGVDGTLRVDSPGGGPTVVEVELPCGS